MKTIKKIFVVFALVTLVVAALAVSAFAAFDLDIDLPAGAVKGDAKWIDSGYADIDAEGSGWIMIGGAVDYSGTTEAYPTIAKADAGRFYWNKTTDKGVYVVTSTDLSANWEDWSTMSVADPTASDQKKMYAFASAFVDEMLGYYGSKAYQTALGGDVAATTEKAVFVNGSNITKYVVYYRYVNTYAKASKQWTNFTVTKASYDSFLAKKAELEATGMTGTELEDALVEFVYENFAGYKMARNVKENGSYVMLTWVWKQLADNGYVFDTVEFRSTQGNSTFSTFGLAFRALETKTVLFENNITNLKLSDNDRGFLYDMDALTTFAHVDFNTDGTYADVVTEGVVDLRGFDSVVSYKTPAVYFTYLLRNSDGPKEVIWFDTIMCGGEEVAGIIDQSAFRAATNLEKIVIPANVTLTKIDTYAFNGCKALKTIEIKGSVSADMTIVNRNAFDGGLTIKVYSEYDKANMQTALNAAGVTGVTVVTTRIEEPDEDDTSVVIPNVISADGFMLRIKEYNGLRALFSFDKDKAAAVAAETGYTLIEYGAIASSAATYEKAGSSQNLFDSANGKKIQRIVIFAEDGTGLNKYVDADTMTYCISVTNFASDTCLLDAYVSGYAIWSDGKNKVVTFSDYVTKSGKNTISLYTLTLEMYKSGAINAQNTEEVCLWDVLKNGAWSVTEADVKAPSDFLALTQGFEYDENGEFTYLDLPLRAWNMYKNSSGNTVWNSMGVDVEDESTTNVLWSILVDGDNFVVVYRAANDDTAKLPKLADQYGASAPYSSLYFTPKDAKETNVTEDLFVSNGLFKYATLYSPILTDANAKKVQTLVIDYGVDGFGDQSLDDTKKSNNIGTIVYPEGMTSTKYLLAGCHALENFIYVTANKSYLDAYEVDSLVDLSGLAKVSDYAIVYNAASIKNLLLPEAKKITKAQQYGFAGAKALERVWTVGYDMPEAGVMDLSQTGIIIICKGYLNNLDNIDDVIMPDTFKTIGAYSMATKGQTTDTARWFLFGNNKTETKLNIHVANWDALNVIANTFYEARQSIEYNDNREGDPNGIAHVIDYLKITYNGETKTVLEWREDFPEKPITDIDPSHNYTAFLTIDWAETAVSIENDVNLVVDGALMDATGRYRSAKISYVIGESTILFDTVQMEAFFDTIDATVDEPTIDDYATYYDDEVRASVMATEEYANQLYINVIDTLGISLEESVKIYAITGQGEDGAFVLTDLDYDGSAFLSYASTGDNELSTKVGTIEFVNGMTTGATSGQFCTVTKNPSVVTTAKNITMTDSTVFTVVARDGIFIYTGKPTDEHKIVLTEDTFIISANSARVMIVDRTRSINGICNLFKFTESRYMLTSVTEDRYNDAYGVANNRTSEFTQIFPGTEPCVNSNYVVFTPLTDDVTLDVDNAEFVLAAELEEYLGTDLAKKLGYVFNLTFLNGKLYDVSECAWRRFVDYGTYSDQISVDASGYLVIGGQKYDQTADKIDDLIYNPANVYDLRLFEYNPNAMNDGIAFNVKKDVSDIRVNMFQEVTLFDTNGDGMCDYGIYVPYYIGNYITSNQITTNSAGENVKIEYFVTPSTKGDYTFQRPGYYTSFYDKVDGNLKARWNSDFYNTYNTISLYTVNPVSMDIKTVESFGRDDFKGEVTEVVNDYTGKIISATVGGKVFTNINKLTDANLKGISGLLAFDEAERMPTALVYAGCSTATWENVFQTVLESNGAYNNMRVYSLGGYTLYAWPSIVRNYNFATFDWTDANFYLDDDVLVVDRALTTASGEYETIRIAAIYNECGKGIHTFGDVEFEAFCDTIDALFAEPTVEQYNWYFDASKRESVMATAEYAKRFRINVVEEIDGSFTMSPNLYAITGQNENGDLILVDVDCDNAALSTYATSLKDNANKVVAGTIEFINGVAKGKFATSSRNVNIITTSQNIVVTDETVFTIVAKEGIFFFTGKPDDYDKLVLTRDTFLIAANTSQIMLVDRTRSINEIAIGDVDYLGKFLAEDNTWFNYEITCTWAWNENTNNCPWGFKWLVDNAYLITSDTKVTSSKDESGIFVYTYSNLYDLKSCDFVQVSFYWEIDLIVGAVIAEDRVYGVIDGLAVEDVFHTFAGINNANWSVDSYVGRLVSGSTVAYYEFAAMGRLMGVAPNLVIITIGSKTTVSTTDLSTLKAGATIFYNLVNGVPTGYAIQYN